MKKLLTMKQSILIAVAMLMSVTAVADVKIKEGKDGWAWASYDGEKLSKFTYVVDKQAQLCFVTYYILENFQPVPCENLAKREEWKPHITWIDSEE